MDKVRNKAAIVTGAGSVGKGIGNGKAAALLSAREGAQVMLVDYNLESAKETKKMIDIEEARTPKKRYLKIYENRGSPYHPIQQNPLFSHISSPLK
jgi:NAD(P)-dependent dehydrogenase (short-subunit alcohol dehydrogenase family)